MKKLYNIIIFSLLCSIAFTQVQKIDRFDGPLYQGKISNEEFFEKSDYIFEGELVSYSDVYIGKDKKKYSYVIVNVKEIYKGNLDTGTVKIFRKIYSMGASGFNYSHKKIYFCKKTSFEMPKEMIKTENKANLSVYEDARFANISFSEDPTYNFELFGLNHMYFKTKNDFYLYISKYKDVKVPGEGLKKKTSLKSGFVESVEDYGVMQARIKSLIETCNYWEQQNNLKPRLKSAMAATELTLAVNNQQVTKSSSKFYYEFDVYAHASLTSTYLQNIFLELNYSKLAFGASISSNSKITVTKLGSYNTNKYNISHMDMSDACMLVILSATDANGGFGRVALPTSSGAAFHVKIEILPNLNSTPSGLAYFVDPIPFALGFSYTNSATAGWPSVVDFTKVNNTPFTAIPVNSVAPTISSLSPLSVNAGLGQTVTITGTNFGSTKGKVKLKNATDGGQTFFEVPSNLITWANTQIVVIVPSYVNNPDPQNPHFTAGTGNVKVVTSNGIEATSTQIVTVNYALMEALSPSNVRTYLAKMNCINGLEFTLHTSIMTMYQSSSAIACIEKALSDWSTKLGITLKLEKNGSTYVTTSNEEEPNRNIIFLDYGASTDMLMGIEYNYGVDFNGKTIYRKLSSNIHINPNMTWNYLTSGTVTNNTISFYQAFLHELGHAVGLDHVIDKTALMHYTIDLTAGSYTIKDLNNSTSTPVTAAQKVVTDSKAITWQRPELGTLGSSIIPTVSISASGSTLICNSSVTLTSTTSTGNKWSTGSTSQSIPVNSTGAYYTTVSQPGCTRTSNTINVTACPKLQTFAINGGNSRTQHVFRWVWLNNNATNVPTQYIASENSNFSGASWQSYGVDPRFTLSKGGGTKVVYLKLKNAAGESNIMTDAILYDPILGLSATTEPEMIDENAPYSVYKDQLKSTELEQVIQIGDYTIYPNPTNEILHISSTGNANLSYIELINLNGAIVLKLNPQQDNLVDINMSELTPGIYMLRLVSDQGIVSKPIIKQ